MDPFKIAGGAMVLLGVIFRAISNAYFNLRLRSAQGNQKAVQKAHASHRRSMLIDYAFIAMGIYVIVTR